VLLATRERAAARMHGAFSQLDWLEPFGVYRAFDANPYVAASAARRAAARLRQGRARVGARVAAESRSASPRRLALRVLDRVWLPDSYAGWLPFGFATGLRAIRRERPAAILSSYPPASSHVLALLLHRATGVPWIADFRDPWANAGDHTYPGSATRLSRRLEHATLEHASAVTAVGPTLAETLAERTAAQVHVLPQGFEPDRDAARRTQEDELRLLHMGTLAAWPAHPGPLLRAAAAAAEHGARLHVDQVGQIFGCEDDVEAAIASGLLTAHDPVTRSEAQRRIAAADVALLIRTEPSRLWVTTKLWDYLAARTPILVVADPECDAARIVTATRTGVVVPYWDEGAIESSLRSLDDQRRAGELRWQPDEAELAQYETSSVARELARVLEQVAR
jgi:hypothetical protein